MFKPGESGNPGGRPKKIPAWVARFRALEPAALELLCAIITGKDKAGAPFEADISDRITAVKLAMAYSRGNPRQAVELTGADGGPIKTETEIIGEREQAQEILRYLSSVGAPPPDTKPG